MVSKMYVSSSGEDPSHQLRNSLGCWRYYCSIHHSLLREKASSNLCEHPSFQTRDFLFLFFSVIVFVTLFCLIVGASGYLECPFVGLKFLVFCDGYPWFLYFSTQDAFYSVEIHCFLGWVSFIFVIQHAGCPFIPLKIITESVIFGDFLMEFLFGLCRFCTGIVIFVDESWTYLFILIFQVVKQKKLETMQFTHSCAFPPFFCWDFSFEAFQPLFLGYSLPFIWCRFHPYSFVLCLVDLSTLLS